ncbi:MAG: hypothetical protein M3O61_15020 [Gemmatimonadota bacterium]|nr:hypothetical protein [Gemmatimonadota bacterium]
MPHEGHVNGLALALGIVDEPSTVSVADGNGPVRTTRANRAAARVGGG